MFVLTSYNDENTDVSPSPLQKNHGANTKDGMGICIKKTKEFAFARENAYKNGNQRPQNTKSDPANRIRSFREDIGSKSSADQNKMQNYKKSLKLLLQCVLAQFYGEKINIVPLKADKLNEKTDSPGRKYFVEKILEALGMDDKIILTLQNRKCIVGLLSIAGPIPVLENGFSLPELQIDETKELPVIIKNLPYMHKGILAYWLKEYTEWLSKSNKPICPLYEDLKNTLEIQENISISNELSNVSTVINVAKTEYGFPDFPVLKEHSEAGLCDRITVVPLIGKKDKIDETPFGYKMEPLRRKVGADWYVFLPPLDLKTIAATNTRDFMNVELMFSERVPLYIENEKIVSVTVCCKLKYMSIDLLWSRTYSGGEIRYIKSFPSLTVYGPVPMHGWIARRDIDIGDYPSPLKSDSAENITLNDIVFANTEIKKKEDKFEVVPTPLDFKGTTDKYALYTGFIPLWLAVGTSAGEILGSLPLCVDPDNTAQEDWKTAPNFIHIKKPRGTLNVAADIGSSRSAILFQREGYEGYDSILIDNRQPLGEPITKYGTNIDDVNFGMMFFQPKEQKEEKKGKTPVGLLTTDAYLTQEKDNIELFNSGKLILLDPESIADASTRKIISDIKAGNDQKAMYLLTESLLVLIIDRAIHLECSIIDLRLSYIKERSSSFMKAWNRAKNKYSERWPEIKIKINEKMCIEESLAIANKLKYDAENDDPKNALITAAGAAIIDIGDFTTDIALFISEPGGLIKLENNFSVQFAGRQIILQPIWDYLMFTNVKIESLYKQDMVKSSECQQAVSRLETAREKQKKEEKRILSDEVRRDLLCLMSILKEDKSIPVQLQNLFDICYLTEIVILKRILRNVPEKKEDNGNFGIHFYGGGRFRIKGKDKGFNWDKTLRRDCNVNVNITPPDKDDGTILASGLLFEKVHDSLKDAHKNNMDNIEPKPNNSDKEESKRQIKVPTMTEFKEAYIRFLQNAQALKNWEVLDVNDRRVSTGKLFNVKKPDKNKDGIIDDEGLFRSIYGVAVEYALAGEITDIEIIKTLFAYKIAYESAIAFYSKKN